MPRRNFLIIGFISLLLLIVGVAILNIKNKPTTSCLCKFENSPVCGTDYITYQNECDARCVGVEVSYRGKCRQFDKSKPLPPSCQPCNLNCGTAKVLFENELGCPFCECRFPESESGD